MFANFLKTTVRNLLKNKTYSFLNIFGLAIGITCAALIFLWVEDEVNYDNFNVKKDRLHLVKVNAKIDAGVFTHSSTPGVMGPAILEEIPGIANSCRVTEAAASLFFKIHDNLVYAEGNFVEPSFFSMFTLPFVQGNAKSAFKQLYSLVITEKTAKKFFGDEKNVLGKTVILDNKQEYVITGVLKDLPQNSTIQFEWLAPFEIWFKESPWANEWGNTSITTYVELEEGANSTAINKQLYGFIKKKKPSSTNHAFLFSMNDWRLYDEFDAGKKTGGGRIEYVRLFSLIAWIILIIACINFMNLATARSEKRAKEVGVRKVLGAGKSRLVSQFLGEALFLAVLATIFAVILTGMILPAFNTLVQKNLSIGLDNPSHILTLAAITLICGLFAGSYPSLYLSSFNPVFVLKGIKLKTGSATLIRKGLVVLQFTVSIVLIIGTIIIYQQVQHAKNRNLGFKKDNLIQIKMRGDLAQKFPMVKQELLNTGYVRSAAITDHPTLNSGNNTTDVSWQGKAPNSQIVISQRLVSPEYISAVNMEIKAGRDFQQSDIPEMGEDFKMKDPQAGINVLITESLENLMGKGSAIGKTLTISANQENNKINLTVVGVVKDYIYGNIYGKPDPVIFYCMPQFTDILYVGIKNQADIEKALPAIGTVLKKHNPMYPFQYNFVVEFFAARFQSEMLVSKLSRVFAALAVIISCLGLFGLAAYTAESRIKEIGIRKVLGASVSRITSLLSFDFIKLVSISALIAFPIAWWTMHNWLQKYPYRIEISWWIFAFAGLLAIIIAVFTISFQAIKAAVSNPVKSLRSE